MVVRATYVDSSWLVHFILQLTSSVCISHNFVYYSLVDWHLVVSTLQQWWLRELWAILYMSCHWLQFSLLLGKYLGEECLGHRGSIHLTIKKMTSFPNWLYHSTLLPLIYENPVFSTSLPSFGNVSLLNLSYFGGQEVVNSWLF